MTKGGMTQRGSEDSEVARRVKNWRADASGGRENESSLTRRKTTKSSNQPGQAEGWGGNDGERVGRKHSMTQGRPQPAKDISSQARLPAARTSKGKRLPAFWDVALRVYSTRFDLTLSELPSKGGHKCRTKGLRAGDSAIRATSGAYQRKPERRHRSTRGLRWAGGLWRENGHSKISARAPPRARPSTTVPDNARDKERQVSPTAAAEG